MVNESVFDVIHGDGSDYEDGDEEEEEEEEEEAGQLRSGFKAMDITREEGGNEDGEMVEENGAARTREWDQRRRVEWDQGWREEVAKAHRRKNRKRRKGDRRNQSMSIERFVVQTCRRIKETKYPLFREAVDRIGVDAMKALLDQVEVVEKCGGQMTADGLRRRSAGGVLWNLLRDHVGPGLYKEIMKEGNRKHIEQQKAKSTERKRQHTDVDTEQDELQNVKRRRTTSVVVDGPASRSGREASRERASLREEADNVRTPAALQNAWIQGLKKQSERGGLNPKPLEGNAASHSVAMKRPVAERIRMTVSYGDLVEEGQVATDSPIHGVTEVGVEEPDDVREEGEMEEGECR